jgi:hypothetical protein
MFAIIIINDNFVIVNVIIYKTIKKHAKNRIKSTRAIWLR